MLQVGIVGGTGYTGVELLRLLAQHPKVQIHTVTSRQDAGMPVSQLFPNLRGFVENVFAAPEQAQLTSCDVVFFATPHGIAMQQAPALLEAGIKVIDLSADFRLRDLVSWEKWYGMPHLAKAWAEKAVYGLPETHRAHIRTASLIANPGCYPTAVQLGLLPLLEAGVIDCEHIIADCKSGLSGAGRKADIKTLFTESSDSFAAYSVNGHRHLPEIQQELQKIAQGQVSLTFVPHLTPMIRGMQATLYTRLNTAVDIQHLYEKRYAEEIFVDVMPANSVPQTRSVRGSNTCRLALYQPGGEKTVVILSVIDNLMKGAAGQAVQNMNIMFGFDESTGLQSVPLLP